MYQIKPLKRRQAASCPLLSGIRNYTATNIDRWWNLPKETSGDFFVLEWFYEYICGSTVYHHGNRSFTFVQDDAFRSPSLWRFPFPITSDVLSSNRHSEQRQTCRMRKTGNGMVTQSEESMTLMTPYRLIQGSWSRPSEGAVAHVVRLRILACRNDLNRKRIVSL